MHDIPRDYDVLVFFPAFMNLCSLTSGSQIAAGPRDHAQNTSAISRPIEVYICKS